VENRILKYRAFLAALLIAFLDPGQAQEAGEMPAEWEVSLDRPAEQGPCYDIGGPIPLRLGESVPVISVLPANTVPWPLLFDHSKTSAELSALAARPSDVVGLTRPTKPFPPVAFFRTTSKDAALRQGSCFWVDSIRLEFTPVQILLASEYPPGSCEYKVTRAHELLHYQDMQILFIRYQALVRAALRQAGFPTAKRPVFVASVMEGMNQTSRLLENTLQPIYAMMDQALQTDADRRDAPEERALTWNKCTNWYARSTGVRPRTLLPSYANRETSHPVPEETASKFPSQHNQ
jgi:hypothetical protein